MEKTILKRNKRDRRHKRIRARVHGTAECPRLAVFKSNRYVTGQVINDENGTTLAQVCSRNVADAKGKPLQIAASLVGKELAEKAKAAGVSKVVFDRGGFIYTGVIAALADGAREGGLTF